MSVDLEKDLFKIEETFWLGGESEFRANLSEQCLLAFPQGGEMHGVFTREEVAKTATASNRWRDLHMTDRSILRVTEAVAFISYHAKVKRADGVPYEALIGSTYKHEAGAWKLATHQHSPL
jgi:hypothetical protein